MLRASFAWSPAPTAAAPTATGTYPVYEHIPSGTMSGTNPDGSHYNDPGIQFISYFSGKVEKWAPFGYSWPYSEGLRMDEAMNPLTLLTVGLYAQTPARPKLVLAIAIDRFVQQGLNESEWEVPDEVLTLFPDDVRAYFRPGKATDRSAEVPLRGQKPTAANS